MKPLVFLLFLLSSLSGYGQEISLKNMIVMLPKAEIEELSDCWLGISTAQKDCEKLIAFRKSDVFPDSLQSEVNADQSCVAVLDDPALFFYSAEKYLELENFKSRKNSGKLIVHLVDKTGVQHAEQTTSLIVKYKIKKEKDTRKIIQTSCKKVMI